MLLPAAPIIMLIFLPFTPVLLLQRGRLSGRTKPEPKPDPMAEL